MNRYRIVTKNSAYADIFAPDIIGALKRFRAENGGIEIISVNVFEWDNKRNRRVLICLYRKTADGRIIREG